MADTLPPADGSAGTPNVPGGGANGNGNGAADGDGNLPVRVAERIEDLRIEQELQDSYLTYAMSTIMDRALPAVRDFPMEPMQGRAFPRRRCRPKAVAAPHPGRDERPEPAARQQAPEVRQD